MRAHAEVTAEIAKLPEGPETGALFDFDGTIIAGYSGLAIMQEQIRRREMRVRDIVASARAMASFSLGSTGFSAMMVATAQFMRGAAEQDYRELCNELFVKEILKRIYPESRALVDAHLRKGHTVAIVSSATQYQVDPAAQNLNIEHVLCTRLVVEDGKFSGEVVRPTCFGEGKVRAAEELARATGMDLDKTFFYTDSDDDIQLLERVGNPRPTNPNRKLAAIAERRGWPVRRFSSRGRPKATELVRSVLATGSMLTSAASAMPIWALTGSKREAQNFNASIYGDIAAALIGMKLDVRGEENLWVRRPAVFLFNHQSKADFIITAKLLRRNFAGVAQKTPNSAGIFNQVMEFGGVVFIDREDPRSAIRAVQSLAEPIREQGISVCIAPEGTRSLSAKLGAFKRGAFQLAMDAQVPVVPIVIHNSMDVSPKGSFVYRAATVDVDVLPPIDTSTWTKATLREHMNDVRNMYLGALGQA